MKAWGSNGEGNGQLNHALDIAVYPCGNNLFVADRNNNRIEMFDSNGTFVRRGTGYGQFEYRKGISVCETRECRLRRFAHPNRTF